MIAYNEPGEGRPVVITEEEAISRQKAAHPNYVYYDDAQALEDFMIVHWAWTTTKHMVEIGHEYDFPISRDPETATEDARLRDDLAHGRDI